MMMRYLLILLGFTFWGSQLFSQGNNDFVTAYYILYSQFVPGEGTVDSVLFLVSKESVIQQYDVIEFNPGAPYKLFDIQNRNVFDIGGGSYIRQVTKMRQLDLTYDIDYVPDSSIIVRNFPVSFAYYTHKEKIYDIYLTDQMGINFFLAGEIEGFPLYYELPYRNGLSKIISYAVRMKKKNMSASYFNIPCCMPYGLQYDYNMENGEVLPGPDIEFSDKELAPTLRVRLSTNEKVVLDGKQPGFTIIYFNHEGSSGDLPTTIKFLNSCLDSLILKSNDPIKLFTAIKDATKETHSQLLLNSPGWNHITNAKMVWAKFRLLKNTYLILIDPTGYIVYKANINDAEFDYKLLDQILFAMEEAKRMNQRK